MFEIKNEKVKKVYSEVKALLKDRKGAHELDHFERVRRMCRIIAQAEGGDTDILDLMAILHDISRDEGKGEKEHANDSVDLAKNILLKYNFLPDVIDRVLCGIETHSSSSNIFKEPEALEAKILFDADKLDGVGPIGILRWFSFMEKKRADPKVSAENYLERIISLEKNFGKLYTKKGNDLIWKRVSYSKNFIDVLLDDLKMVGEV